MIAAVASVIVVGGYGSCVRAVEVLGATGGGKELRIAGDLGDLTVKN